MRIVKLLLTLFATLTFIGCNQGYKTVGNKVYYEFWNEAVGHGEREIKNADAHTFRKLNFDCSCDFDFGRDKKHLFINGEIISSVDPNTFKFLGSYVFADRDSAYFFGFYNNLNHCAVPGIDLSKLRLIKYPWSRAGNILIYGKDTLTIKDIDDFEPLDEDWGKTRSEIVNHNRILLGADPGSFKIINSYSGEDKHHVYEFGRIKK